MIREISLKYNIFIWSSWFQPMIKPNLFLPPIDNTEDAERGDEDEL